MFWNKKKKEKSRAEEKAKAEQIDKLRRGLIFLLPGASTRLYVYIDRCILHCSARTKEPEKDRVIDFNDILDVRFAPPSAGSNGHLQIVTKQRPNVKRSFWYAYENNMVVVHASSVELAEKVYKFLKNPASLDIPPEQINQLRRMRKEDKRREAEEKELLEKGALEIKTEAPEEPEPENE